MKIVCISDTHTYHDQVEIPECDILVHAGDFSIRGYLYEVFPFRDWLVRLLDDGRCKDVVLVPGNHELMFDPTVNKYDSANFYKLFARDHIHLLVNQSRTVQGVRFFGTPYTPRFFDWAFQLDSHEQASRVFSQVTECDVVVSHGPPKGILDATDDGRQVGNLALNEFCDRVKPKLCVFGHIHHSYGQMEKNGTLYVNAAACTEARKPTNPPIVIEI